MYVYMCIYKVNVYTYIYRYVDTATPLRTYLFIMLIVGRIPDKLSYLLLRS